MNLIVGVCLPVFLALFCNQNEMSSAQGQEKGNEIEDLAAEVRSLKSAMKQREEISQKEIVSLKSVIGDIQKEIAEKENAIDVLKMEMRSLETATEQRDRISQIEILSLNSIIRDMQKKIGEENPATGSRMPFGSPIAFSFGLPEEFSADRFDPQIIPFTHNIVNHGDAYDPELFIFTAPVRGIYYFSITIGPHVQGLVNIVINGEPVAAACTHATGGALFTGDAASVAVFLEAYDRAWATLEDGSLGTILDDSGYRNVFNGFLYAQL